MSKSATRLILTGLMVIGLLILTALNAGSNACEEWAEGSDAYYACLDLEYP